METSDRPEKNIGGEGSYCGGDRRMLLLKREKGKE